MHQRHAVTAQRLVHEVGGNEDGHAVFARQLHQQLPKAVAGHRIDTRSGLVENQHFRCVDHRHRQRQALAHAQRQGFRQAVGLLDELEAFEHFPNARLTALGRQVEQPSMQVEVLPYRQFAVQREGLGHVADPLAGLHVMWIHRLAEQQGLPLGGRQQTCEHLHGGGLATAVGAEKAEDLPALDAQIHAIHRNEVAEAHGQVVGFDGDAVAGLARWDFQRAMASTLLFRQQANERLLQAVAVGARQQFSRRAGGENSPCVHRHQMIEALRLVHVGSGHQHAHLWPFGSDAVDQLPELRPRQGVDAGGGLIEDQQVGVVDQRATEAELLLHAAG